MEKRGRGYPGKDPEQPKEWLFLKDWEEPLHAGTIRWERKKPAKGEIAFFSGIRLVKDFPDPEGLLTSAFEDFHDFLASAGVRSDSSYPVRLTKVGVGVPEQHQVRVGPEGCEIRAGDAEGIRRALIWIEDEMLRRAGPFLPAGTVERKPFAKSRIILDVGAYTGKWRGACPDSLLQRIVHNGYNGLWQHLPGRLAPEMTGPWEEWFPKCRATVQRYRRHGLKLYLLAVEPAAFPADSPLLRKYPALKGHPGYGFYHYCTGTPQGRRLIAESCRRLFSEVPGLAGIVVLCVGERGTHCYSMSGVKEVKSIFCPRCGPREPKDVLAETLEAVAKGVHSVCPEADVVAWPYMQNVCWGEARTREAAARVPRGVILQHNFEHAGRGKQLGKIRRADDYWLSYAGPSRLFRDCAEAARKAGTPVFAKLMVACSHEMSSVPHVPVPGLVYEKFRGVRQTGAVGIFANWGSGNDPSFMNRAAGELAFEPFPRTKREFLLRLARRDWGRNARRVVKAWEWFEKGFRQCPLTIGFSYFGPMHEGPTWPLYLIPRDLPLPKNWQVSAPAGDRIGESTGYHTLRETIVLSQRMLRDWRKGVRRMRELAPQVRDNPERMQDIAVAQALELQFESGCNILTFYELREKLACRTGNKGLALLEKMRRIVLSEMDVDRRLLPLAEEYPRLGFCPEAAGYKYFPEKIRWRMETLKRLLKEEFPAVRQRLEHRLVAFPHYTGQEPVGCVYRCRPVARRPRMDGRPFGDAWENLRQDVFSDGKGAGQSGRTTAWKAGYDNEAIYFGFTCGEPRMERLVTLGQDRGILFADDRIMITFETSQFLPKRRFIVNAAGAREYMDSNSMNVIDPAGGEKWIRYQNRPSNYRWSAAAFHGKNVWHLTVRIPFRALKLDRFDGKPLKVILERDAGPPEERVRTTWVGPDTHPLNMGWLVFEERGGKGDSGDRMRSPLSVNDESGRVTERR